MVYGGFGCEFKKRRPPNYSQLAFFFFFALQFLHLRVIKLRLGFLGPRGKWFGWFRGELGCDFSCSYVCIAVFVALQFALHLRLLKLRLRFLRLRRK